MNLGDSPDATAWLSMHYIVIITVTAIILPSLLLQFRKQPARLHDASATQTFVPSPKAYKSPFKAAKGKYEIRENPITKKSTIAIVEALEKGWGTSEPVHVAESLRVWYRFEGGSIHSMKYEVVLPFEPGPCVALAREIDLMPTWHKFIPKAFTLEEIKDVFGGIYGYAELWCPWPLKNRALVMRTAAFDALDEPIQAFVVDVSSDEYPGEPSKLPTTEEECPRLSFSSYTTFTPLPPDEDGNPQTKWTLYCDRTDYQVSNLPHFVIAFFYKVMAPFVIQIAQKLIQTQFTEGSLYSNRMLERDQFYGAITMRCRDFLSKLSAGSRGKKPVYPSPVSKSGAVKRQLFRAPPKRIMSCPASLDSFEFDSLDMPTIHESSMSP